jgi:hypothetical protein
MMRSLFGVVVCLLTARDRGGAIGPMPALSRLRSLSSVRLLRTGQTLMIAVRFN